MGSPLSIDALKANLNNPGRDYLWDIVITTPIGASVSGLSGQASQVGLSLSGIPGVAAVGGVTSVAALFPPGDSDVLRFRARSAQIPGREVGAILIPFRQTAGFRVPGKLKYTHNWDCSFVDGEDGRIHNILYSWQRAIADDTTGVTQPPDSIKGSARLTLLSTTGAEYSRIDLFGVFPLTMSPVALLYDNSDGKEIVYPTVFSYDRWEKR